MKKFSLFLPSRERLYLLADCIGSFFRNATHPNRIEMIVVVDDDDKSWEKLEQHCQSAAWDVTFLSVPRSNFPTRDYLNFACSKLSGDYFWGLNDDVEMMTPGWDIIMDDKIGNFIKNSSWNPCFNPSLYVHMNDDSHMGEDADKKGCCFPLINKELYAKLGCYMPSEIPTWGADTVLYDIVKRAKIPILRLPDVILKHKCHHNGSRERDSVNKHMEDISGSSGPIDRDVLINSYVQKMISV